MRPSKPTTLKDQIKVVLTVLIIVVAGCAVFSHNLNQYQIQATPTNSYIPSFTSTPTFTQTSFFIDPSPTSTPYIITYNGFLYCRLLPDTRVEPLTMIRGEPITIINQNQTRDWFLVNVQGFDKPCWIYRYSPRLTLIPYDITRIPTFEITVVITLELPLP